LISLSQDNYNTYTTQFPYEAAENSIKIGQGNKPAVGISWMVSKKLFSLVASLLQDFLFGPELVDSHTNGLESQRSIG